MISPFPLDTARADELTFEADLSPGPSAPNITDDHDESNCDLCTSSSSFNTTASSSPSLRESRSLASSLYRLALAHHRGYVANELGSVGEADPGYALELYRVAADRGHKKARRAYVELLQEIVENEERSVST